MKKQRQELVSRVLIKYAREMSDSELHELALWLRRLGAFVERKSEEMSSTFTARKWKY